MDNQSRSPTTPQPASKPTAGKGYGRRPLWQWIVLYAIIGGLVYYGIYYFAVAKKDGYQTANTNTASSSPY